LKQHYRGLLKDEAPRKEVVVEEVGNDLNKMFPIPVYRANPTFLKIVKTKKEFLKKRL